MPICKRPRCSKPAREGKRYCSDKCRNHHYVIRYRARKKAGVKPTRCPKCDGTGWLDYNPTDPV